MKHLMCILLLTMLTTGCGKPEASKEARMENEKEELTSIKGKFDADLASGKYTLSSSDDQGKADPVSVAVNECLSKAESVKTSSRLGCSDVGVKLYSNNITALNGILLKYSTTSERELLSTAQNSWQAYVNSQIQAVNSVRSNVRGTMFTEAASNFELSLYKKRYEDLKFLVELKENALCPDGECG